jgi:phosphoribosylpyrophosphate synthetase
MHKFAQQLRTHEGPTNKRFELHNILWKKFDDGTDHIIIDGIEEANGEITNTIQSPTFFKGKDLLFVASFYNNDVTMSQFHVISHLCESFAKSLTVLLPYYSTATMERVDIYKDGVVPTASTLARFFNGLPSMGYPIRLMTYDLHTLQNRFFISGHALASLHTATKLMVEEIKLHPDIDALAFPDAGAHKRFAELFKTVITKDKTITCEKVREGAKRFIKVIEGETVVKQAVHILIVDDILNSGGTLIACAEKLRELNGKVKISIYTTHAVFGPKFFENLDDSKFERFESVYTTDSIPNTVTDWKSEGLPTTTIRIPRESAENTNHKSSLKIKLHIFKLAQQVIKDL